MGGPILYFLLLVLGVPLNLGPDVGHERGGFSKTLLEKDLEFIPSEGGGLIALNLGLVLLPAEVDSVPEERGCEGNTLGPRGTGRVEMILTLSTEVVALYVGTTIV